MFAYEKKLQYPVNIKQPNPKLARVIVTQLGGPDGELGAALRYLSQRYAMPYGEVSGILTDIGTEELGHVEMISTIVYQLTRNLTPEEINRSGFDTYFVDHTTGIYPIAASGQPFTASFFQSAGDVITDLTEDMAAEQKARTTYANILRRGRLAELYRSVQQVAIVYVINLILMYFFLFICHKHYMPFLKIYLFSQQIYVRKSTNL